MKLTRLFIAASVPTSEIVKDLVALQQALKTNAAFRDCRWIPPENFHLTLHFLGDVDEPRAAELENRLRALSPRAAETPAQRLDRLKAFPHPRAATVLVLGGDVVSPALSDAYERVKPILVDLAIPIENRPYSPHITLARMRRPARWRREDLPEVPAFVVPPTELVLYESVREAHGSLYRVRLQFALPGPAGVPILE